MGQAGPRLGRGVAGDLERGASPEQFIRPLRRAEESGKVAIVDVAVSRELPPPVTRYEAAELRKV
jgi:hypothetical protein